MTPAAEIGQVGAEGGGPERQPEAHLSQRSTFALIAAGTVLGIAGTDLVLPAVPGLPAVLPGTPAEAQLVLAAFTGGAAVGLLVYGELGARFDQRRLLVVSLALYAATSALCVLCRGLDQLTVLRALQGAAGAGPAVFAPGMLRAIYGDGRAVAAIGLLGSIESLVPALAPVAGLGLLALGGWTSSFIVLAALAAGLAVAVARAGERLPRVVTPQGSGGYGRLLGNGAFLSLVAGFALTLGALLVVVFAAPALFTLALGATLTDFIVMQIDGIATFALCANLSARFVGRWGARRVIAAGGVIGAAGAALLLAYAIAGGRDTVTITAIFLLFNIGHGLRGPPSFHGAIVASGGNDARAAAILVVALLGVASAGTAAVAPSVTQGLVPVALAAALLHLGALGSLLVRPVT